MVALHQVLAIAAPPRELVMEAPPLVVPTLQIWPTRLTQGKFLKQYSLRYYHAKLNIGLILIVQAALVVWAQAAAALALRQEPAPAMELPAPKDTVTLQKVVLRGPQVV